MQETIRLKDGREVRLRVAQESDMHDLKALYYEVYGGRYTLKEVTDRDKMKWVMHDSNYLWLLAEAGEKIVGAVLFIVDPKQRISKALAGVVRSDYQGQRLMQSTIREGMNRIMEEEGRADLIYAVVRTVSDAPQRLLQRLGFVGLGIFPNVRKVKAYETHGLQGYFRETALQQRGGEPHLIPPVYRIFETTSKSLNLGGARVEEVILPDEELRGGEEIKFLIERSKEVEWEYNTLRNEGKLILEFFPFHYPNVKLHTRDLSTEVFLNIEEDGHAGVLGLKTARKDLVNLLNRVSEYAESMGVKYLELLIPASDPQTQKRAYHASFLPCAYFPAFRMGEEEKRIDYVVTFRSFVPLHFSGLKLTDKTKPYLTAFYKIYTKRLMEEIEGEA